MTEPTKGRRGRPRTGSVVWTKSGWCARVTVTIDGERVKQWFKLGTTNRTVARRKLRRILEESQTGVVVTDQKQIELIDEYAATWLESRERRGVASVGNERRYYEHVWKPVIGRLRLDEVSAGIIQSTLDDAAEGEIVGLHGDKYSRESITQVRAVLVRMLGSAWREEIISENPAKRTAVPEMDEPRSRAAS